MKNNMIRKIKLWWYRNFHRCYCTALNFSVTGATKNFDSQTTSITIRESGESILFERHKSHYDKGKNDIPHRNIGILSNELNKLVKVLDQRRNKEFPFKKDQRIKYRGFPAIIMNKPTLGKCIIKAAMGEKEVVLEELQEFEETIICSAIHYLDNDQHLHQPKNIEKGFVICGRRHHNCIITASIFNFKTSGINHVQGFLTNHDRFVNRKEAAKIAFEIKQIEKETTELHSEDLY